MSWVADLPSCVSLLPTDPKDVCVTGLSLVLIGGNSGSEEVGGLAELSRIGAAGVAFSDAEAGTAWPSTRYVLAAFLAAAVTVLGGAWFMRRRLNN